MNYAIKLLESKRKKIDREIRNNDLMSLKFNESLSVQLTFSSFTDKNQLNKNEQVKFIHQ